MTPIGVYTLEIYGVQGILGIETGEVQFQISAVPA